MIVQIYETTSPEEARELVRVGVDHVGVLVGKGRFPREVDYIAARKIFSVLPGETLKVALTLSDDFLEIAEAAEKLQPNILHIGTLPVNFPPNDAKRLKAFFPGLQMMIAIPVVDSGAVEIARSYAGAADFLLLDTYREGDNQIGATGRVHDWEISRRIVESVRIPVILAGGLGADNVTEAIRKVRPYGVDSKTRTDSETGRGKDIEKVAAFVRIAKSAV